MSKFSTTLAVNFDVVSDQVSITFVYLSTSVMSPFKYLRVDFLISFSASFKRFFLSSGTVKSAIEIVVPEGGFALWMYKDNVNIIPLLKYLISDSIKYDGWGSSDFVEPKKNFSKVNVSYFERKTEYTFDEVSNLAITNPKVYNEVAAKIESGEFKMI